MCGVEQLYRENVGEEPDVRMGCAPSSGPPKIKVKYLTFKGTVTQDSSPRCFFFFSKNHKTPSRSFDLIYIQISTEIFVLYLNKTEIVQGIL